MSEIERLDVRIVEDVTNGLPCRFRWEVRDGFHIVKTGYAGWLATARRASKRACRRYVERTPRKEHWVFIPAGSVQWTRFDQTEHAA